VVLKGPLFNINLNIKSKNKKKRRLFWVLYRWLGEGKEIPMKSLRALTEQSVRSICEDAVGGPWAIDRCQACGMEPVWDELRGLCTACGRVRSALPDG